MNWKMNFRTLTLLIGLILFFDSCGSNQKENTDNKSADSLFAMDQLQGSLTDSTLHNCVDRKRILIKNKNMAISIAEPILFSIYGEQKIKEQKPYKIFNIDNYWVIYGTLKYEKGGTFMIIIDSHDCRVIRITHGK